jgi:hypothetical protein
MATVDRSKFRMHSLRESFVYRHLDRNIFSLGAGDHVVGVSRFCISQKKRAVSTKVGGHNDPVLEKILVAKTRSCGSALSLG